MDFETIWKRVGGLKPITGDRFQPASLDALEGVEASLGSNLPDDYREFLATYGAAAFRRLVRFSPVRQLPSDVSYSGSDYIDAFYGTEPSSRDAYSLLHRIAFYQGRMPDGVIPIGDNGLGNQICLAVTGDWRGQVLYWDRNTEVDEEEYIEDHGHSPTSEVRFGNIHLIAQSFAEFLQGLVADPDD